MGLSKGWLAAALALLAVACASGSGPRRDVATEPVPQAAARAQEEVGAEPRAASNAEAAGKPAGGPAPGDAATPAAERPRIPYRGFSLAPPASQGWEMRQGEQAPTAALLRKPLPSPTHSMLVQVRMFAEEKRGESIEKVGERLRDSKVGQSTRFELVKFEQLPDASFGAGCHRYRLEVTDKAAPNAHGVFLSIVEQGYNCPHPKLKNVVVNAHHSERGRREELDPALQAEGESILRGMRFEALSVEPGP